MSIYRVTSDELNYYGSDLNKFIDEFCTRKMTAINIDLLTYKRSLRQMRVIESKHKNENIPTSQYEALKVFSRAVIPNVRFDVYIHEGNPPYEISEIYDMKTEELITVNREELIRFLNYGE